MAGSSDTYSIFTRNWPGPGSGMGPSSIENTSRVSGPGAGRRASFTWRLASDIAFSPIVVAQGSGLSTFLADLVLHNACFVFVVRKVSAEVFSVSSNRGDHAEPLGRACAAVRGAHHHGHPISICCGHVARHHARIRYRDRKSVV